MKRLHLLFIPLLAVICICCSSSPKDKTAVKSKTISDSCEINLVHQNRYVNDFTYLFTPAQRSFLDSVIGRYEETTTNQLVVATIDSNTLGKCDILDFSTALGKKWGVGQKEKNNGIVMTICVEKRKIGIATGYGMEDILTSEILKDIIENIIKPEYKQSNYFEGTRKGVQAIIEKTK